jgi:hypothetical protein
MKIGEQFRSRFDDKLFIEIEEIKGEAIISRVLTGDEKGSTITDHISDFRRYWEPLE